MMHQIRFPSSDHIWALHVMCELFILILYMLYDVINIGGIVFQPHLQRTKLCEMADSDLEPTYVERRDQLKELDASIMHPKIVQGKTLTGKELASFLEEVFSLIECSCIYFKFNF